VNRDITASLQDNPLLKEVEEISGTPVATCYQCGKCTGSCPMGGEHEGGPREVIRLLQLGLREEAFKMTAAWRCVGCMTCSSRCPFGIDIPKIMDAVRRIAKREGVKLDGPAMKVDSFIQAFLDGVRDYGRLFEATLMIEYNLNSGYLLTNFHKAGVFLARRKLSSWPVRLKRIDRLRRMFDRIAEEEKWPQ